MASYRPLLRRIGRPVTAVLTVPAAAIAFWVTILGSLGTTDEPETRADPRTVDAAPSPSRART